MFAGLEETERQGAGRVRGCSGLPSRISCEVAGTEYGGSAIEVSGVASAYAKAKQWVSLEWHGKALTIFPPNVVSRFWQIWYQYCAVAPVGSSA